LSEKDVPTAAVAKIDGKPNQQYKRKLSNFLLDRKLQLRYVILVTALSAIITGALGFLMYRQEAQVTEDLTAQVRQDFGDDLAKQAQGDMEAHDQGLVLKMVAVGAGLVLILSLYLTVMTHKVAGPLYKVSLYFDKMAAGKLGKVTALRKGDMLVDFYTNFRDAHDAMRARQQADMDTLDNFLTAAAGVVRTGGVGDEIDELTRHVKARRENLVDFPPRPPTSS